MTLNQVKSSLRLAKVPKAVSLVTGSLLLMLVYFSCSTSEKTSGTMVGTENVIQARVLDSDGSPTAARMVIRELDSVPAAFTGSTPEEKEVLLDSTGILEVELDSESDYALEGNSMDSSEVLWIPRIKGQELAEGVNLGDIQLKAPGAIKGKVIFKDANIKKVLVGFVDMDRFVLKGDYEYFTIENIPPGVYTLRVYMLDEKGELYQWADSDEFEVVTNTLLEFDPFELGQVAK